MAYAFNDYFTNVGPSVMLKSDNTFEQFVNAMQLVMSRLCASKES